MSKDLINILYNPSSINSVEVRTELAAEETTDRPEEALGVVRALLDSKTTENSVHAGIDMLKRRLTLPVPLGMRHALIKDFNRLLALLAARFTSKVYFFRNAIQITTLIKEQVETRPQNAVQVLRGEWIELEKCIYNLSAWESQLDYYWSAAH